jgi:hypothetical protein
MIQHGVISIETTSMLQNFITCNLSLFGYKNWDSSLSTETGYIQDSQVSVTSKGSVFSVCNDIQATLGSTQSPPLHTAKWPLHGAVHHSTTHMHGKYSGPSSYDRPDIRTTWVMTKVLDLTYDQSFELRPKCWSRPKCVSACVVVNKDPRCVCKRQSEPKYAYLWT